MEQQTCKESESVRSSLDPDKIESPVSVTNSIVIISSHTYECYDDQAIAKNCYHDLLEQCYTLSYRTRK